MTSLPKPSGPYSVGFFDYEWLPEVESTHLDARHVLVRVYYPSLQQTHNVMGPEWDGLSSWIPSDEYNNGNNFNI